MYHGSSNFANGSSYNGNSFADLGSPRRPVAPYKFGISQAAMMCGEGVV